MNLNQIIARVLRLFGRKRGARGAARPAPVGKRGTVTPGADNAARSARDTAKRARRAAKVTRRGGR